MRNQAFISAALLLAALSAEAQHFRILLDNSDMVPNVDVTATSVANVVTARLVNREEFDLQCSIRFDTGAEKRTRRLKLKAGGDGVATYSVGRPNATQKVRVHAVCDIADAGEE